MIERIVVGAMGTNCYIYANGKKECVIIDPGGEEDTIISSISMLKMVPIGIILTHGHFDHTAAVGKLKRAYREQDIALRVAIHEKDRRFLGRRAAKTNRETLTFLGLPDQASLEELFADLPDPDLILHEGEEVFNTGLVVIETPGHTPGSICLYSEKEGLVFSGDSLFFQGIGRTDLPGGDEKGLLEAIRTKLLTLPPETRVFPGHGVATTVERELVGNPFIR